MKQLPILILLLCGLLMSVTVIPTAEAAKSGKGAKVPQPLKEKLVLMPMRLSEEDKSLLGAMETALVQGLQQKYEVFSGEQVAQKAREIFMKESHSTAKKECDETRCMQDIAGAFQAELIATANVTKREDGYFLAISIQNIFDNMVVYSNSIPCRNCDSYQVVEKLKELSGVGVAVVPAAAPPEPVKTGGSANDPETALWTEVQKGNSKDDYEAYLAQYPKGKYIALAKARIKKLQDEAAAESERKEQEAWEAADKAGSEDSYQGYVKSYPSGRYASLAQVRIRRLQTELAAKQEAERQRQQAEQQRKDAEAAAERQRQEAEAERKKRELPKGFVSQGGLTWMPVTFLKNWSDANAYCNNTAINGQNGWRLPTKEELSALYSSGAMNGQGWTLSYTWSSTPDGSGRHDIVVLPYGVVLSYIDTLSFYVSCVH